MVDDEDHRASSASPARHLAGVERIVRLAGTAGSSADAFAFVSSSSVCGIGVGHDARPRLDVRRRLHDRRPDRDAEVEVARERQVPDRPGVRAARVGSCSAISSIARRFGAPVTVPAGKVDGERVERVQVVAQVALDGRDDVHHLREPLDQHQLGRAPRSRGRRRDRGRCGPGPRASRAPRAPSGRRAARARAVGRGPRSRRAAACRRWAGWRPGGPRTRTSGSGEEPASSSPSIRTKNMYGAGLATRSRR